MKTQTQSACGARNLIPLSRFPQGEAGAGMVPPTPGHVSCQQTALSRSVHRLPPQEGFQSALSKISSVGFCQAAGLGTSVIVTA
jgi:hypothetical protein